MVYLYQELVPWINDRHVPATETDVAAELVQLPQAHHTALQTWDEVDISEGALHSSTLNAIVARPRICTA